MATKRRPRRRPNETDISNLYYILTLIYFTNKENWRKFMADFNELKTIVTGLGEAVEAIITKLDTLGNDEADQAEVDALEAQLEAIRVRLNDRAGE